LPAARREPGSSRAV